MSAALISFFLTVGCCTWLYLKFQNRSGNNTRQSLIATSVIGLLLFFFTLSLLSLVIK